MLSPWKQNTAAAGAIVRIVQTTIEGLHRTVAAAVIARGSASARAPPPTYPISFLRCERPSAVKIYIDLEVFQIIY